MSIAVVVLTYGRLHLLRQCVENVLARASPETTEIVLWDNASADGTAAYLDSLDDPRLTVVHHDANIGQNAYARAFRLTSADYLVELDDDIVDAPEDWDRMLRDALVALPDVGFISANLVDNPHDHTARVMYGENAGLYSVVEEKGVRLKVGGPVGGGCAMTPAALYREVGGFREKRRQVFWQEEAAYIADIAERGYRAVYLEDLRVLHAGGSHYAELAPAQHRFWTRYYRRAERRERVKRTLLRIPLVRPLNDRLRLFTPPS